MFRLFIGGKEKNTCCFINFSPLQYSEGVKGLIII